MSLAPEASGVCFLPVFLSRLEISGAGESPSWTAVVLCPFSPSPMLPLVQDLVSSLRQVPHLLTLLLQSPYALQNARTSTLIGWGQPWLGNLRGSALAFGDTPNSSV